MRSITTREQRHGRTRGTTAERPQGARRRQSDNWMPQPPGMGRATRGNPGDRRTAPAHARPAPQSGGRKRLARDGRSKPGTLGPPPTALVAKARRMRKSGKSYGQIDRALGLPPRSGPSRSWYLVNAPDEYARLRKEGRRRAPTHRARSGASDV